MRDELATEAENTGPTRTGPPEHDSTMLTFEMTMLVKDKVSFGPAGMTDEGMTPGQLLDMRLLGLAKEGGKPHSFTIEFGDEMWAGMAEVFKTMEPLHIRAGYTDDNYEAQSRIENRGRAAKKPAKPRH